MAQERGDHWSWREVRRSRLLMFLAFHAVLGVMIAILCVAAILYFDVAEIASLTRGKPYGPVAIAALTVAMSVTFGSAQIAFAVAFVAKPGERPEEEPDDP